MESKQSSPEGNYCRKKGLRTRQDEVGGRRLWNRLHRFIIVNTGTQRFAQRPCVSILYILPRTLDGMPRHRHGMSLRFLLHGAPRPAIELLMILRVFVPGADTHLTVVHGPYASRGWLHGVHTTVGKLFGFCLFLTFRLIFWRRDGDGRHLEVERRQSPGPRGRCFWIGIRVA